ncbi:MAG: hypothetical protein CL625_07870 [Arenimonas sp.]|nr:hypothetical protein [Arenimonas sp.]
MSATTTLPPLMAFIRLIWPYMESMSTTTASASFSLASVQRWAALACLNAASTVACSSRERPAKQMLRVVICSCSP